MAYVQPVSAYRIADSKLFESEHEATRHETKLRLLGALEHDPIMGNIAGSEADADDLLRWINDHAEIVQHYIEELE